MSKNLFQIKIMIFRKKQMEYMINKFKCIINQGSIQALSSLCLTFSLLYSIIEIKSGEVLL